MVQEFHVLRCFSCQTFQVQQVKKVNRWSCKLCGEKQSLLKEFGRGSGADCRRHVQKLNAMRGAVMEEQDHNTWSLWKQVDADVEDEPQEQRDDQVTQTQVSCWSKYLDTPEEAEPEGEEEEKVLMDRQQLHGNSMIDRKRKRREGWTDRGGQDGGTPEQSNWPSLMTNPVRPTARTTSLNHTRTTSPNRTSPPSLNHTRTTSPNCTSPPSPNRTSPPSLDHTRTTSLYHTSPPSLDRTSAPSLDHTRTTSLNRTSAPSLDRTRTTSLNSINPPSVSTGPVSRWARFLSSDCQVKEEGEKPSVRGWSQPVSGAASLSCNDITHVPPPIRRRPLFPVSSMFQSEGDFSFDEEFLTADYN